MHCVYAYLNALRLCKKMNPGQNDRGSFLITLPTVHIHAHYSVQKEDS
jgi:hypothetical protein